MFIEELGGEDGLYQKFVENRGLDETEICKEECKSSASGTIGKQTFSIFLPTE